MIWRHARIWREVTKQMALGIAFCRASQYSGDLTRRELHFYRTVREQTHEGFVRELLGDRCTLSLAGRGGGYGSTDGEPAKLVDVACERHKYSFGDIRAEVLACLWLPLSSSS